MIEAYRVRKQFQWNGYVYAPNKNCNCMCTPECNRTMGGECESCQKIRCKCECTINKYNFAGDIWLVEAGHPRKDAMINSKQVIGDATIPDVEKLLLNPEYKRLLSAPEATYEDIERVKNRTKSRRLAKAG